jgi:hypothetical protein
MHLDPRPSEDNVFAHARVDIVRVDETAVGSISKTVVKSVEFGPPDAHERVTFKDKVTVNWENPEHHHVINVYSETGVPLSFTLAATKQSPLSDKSVLIAALIMIFVYVFILLEVIHRTLVSIFGSMVALFFFFLMHNGETESIKVSTVVAWYWYHGRLLLATFSYFQLFNPLLLLSPSSLDHHASSRVEYFGTPFWYDGACW